MNFFFSVGERDGFAAVGGDQVDLGGFASSLVFFAASLSSESESSLFFFGFGFALGEEGDPTAIEGPFGFGVVTRLRELDERALCRRGRARYRYGRFSDPSRRARSR